MASSTATSFVYETLDALSFPTTDADDSFDADGYAVLRNYVSSSTSVDIPDDVPAADYFSLDVSADSDERPPPPPLAPPSFASRAENSQKTTASESAWFRSAGHRFKSPMIQLHKEILDFCDFVSPTPEEQDSRAAAVERVSESIKYIWPHCKVEVFGSFRTGLYLPTSDIDVVILDSNIRTPQMGLHALARELKQRSIAKKIQVIAKARVPIIKFVEKRSGSAFDISFDIEGGPKAADFIKDAVKKLPPLRPLCMILKVFLQQRELNEVYSGGIGSYTLLSMLIAHLQMHWRGQDIHRCRQSMEHNLGILLVNFFDLYGRKLNTSDVGVSCNSTSNFFKKIDKGFLNTERPYLLSVEDPQAPDNDIGRSSFNYFKVRSAFSLAYSLLTDAKAINALGPHKSILGTIIRPDPVLLDRKGGEKGELTFDRLLPGTGDCAPYQLENGTDVLYNWQFVDDEPLPREILPREDTVPSPKKKKALKAKHLKFVDDDEPLTMATSKKKRSLKAEHRLRKCDDDESSKSKHKANGGSSREPAAKKKKRSAFRDGRDGGSLPLQWNHSR
ncbi:non-canonical poly(A) RNA polymerase PAPD5 isoform X1 [Iris pallida]|uniref:polynucleotide adenylyltransferase n=1 Tax=Iris pallida TaxID=29817 RepID=A0AAX6IFA5_IRIPA|nr:non-canonical poly(A) RNA polymerase PAPD5 isoform X1 [Iris pallida]